MIDPLYDKVMISIKTAESLYHRLVLLVGEAGSGKTALLGSVAERFGVSIINVNLLLSYKLLEMTAKQRAIRLPEVLGQIVRHAQPLALLDNLEILFDKDLKQDPMRLLQGLSRNQTVVASWNGTTNFGKLLYAKIDHFEYRCYDSVDALIVNIDGEEIAN